MNSKLARELPDVMFKYQIQCTHPGIVSVVVSMREVDREFVYPVENGKAYVDIFMDEYNIAFEDMDSNRYMRTCLLYTSRCV